MSHPNQQLAYNLINYSVKLQAGEKILIEVSDSGRELAEYLVEEVYKVGGVPHVIVKDAAIQRQLLLGATEEQMSRMGRMESMLMSEMDAYIGYRGAANLLENIDVPAEKQALQQLYWSKPVHMEIRVPKTRWCVLRYPSPALAQAAQMSTRGYQDFFYRVCTLDYGKMAEAVKPLKELMERTDKVHITGPGTDLRFSIKGIPAVPCCGEMNIPDGEIYTAPVKDSVEGHITYSIPSIYQSVRHQNVRLEFEKGKIVKSDGSHPELLEKIFNTDEGARYIGEFAIGFNPWVTQCTDDILFDEKMVGSIHFTPGNAYDDADNGNRSAVHWDLVNAQSPEFGGGDIYFDHVLIRKDGRFVLPELECLNPENLK